MPWVALTLKSPLRLLRHLTLLRTVRGFAFVDCSQQGRKSSGSKGVPLKQFSHLRCRKGKRIFRSETDCCRKNRCYDVCCVGRRMEDGSGKKRGLFIRES